MSNAPKSYTKKPLHQRAIQLSSFALDEDRVLVEGSLVDQRYVPIYDVGGEVRDKGIVHDMKIRLIVSGIPPQILEAEAEMLTYPHPECPSTLGSIEKIKGLKLKAGFGEKIRHIMGGVKGCVHLTHLLTTMAQEIFAGSMTHRLSKPRPIPESIEDVRGLEYLVNSCKVWREDGPLYARIKSAIDSARSYSRALPNRRNPS